MSRRWGLDQHWIVHRVILVNKYAGDLGDPLSLGDFGRRRNPDSFSAHACPKEIGMMLILLALVAGAAVYSLLSIFAALRFLATRRRAPSALEPISILKPLAGLDAGLESNLRTCFEQDYPRFEILFAVRESDDPSIAIVEKLCAEYSHIPARLMITGEPPYANAKVFSRDRMLAAAANDLV